MTQTPHHAPERIAAEQMDDFDETNEETSRQNDDATMGKNQA